MSMTWHSGKPVIGDKISDSLLVIRENFQHLAPLAQAVGELQAVSGLAQITDDLQAVSGLAQAVDELQAVSELAPYIQAILNSRIIEMGSNSNGWYVRWENGLQVCFVKANFSPDWTQKGWGYYSGPHPISLPATFVSPPFATIGMSDSAVGDRSSWCPLLQPSTSEIIVWVSAHGNVTTALGVTLIVIGFWK